MKTGFDNRVEMVLQSVERTMIKWNKNTFHFFGGFDYHRLSSHPAVIKAHNSAANQFGLSSGGSRVTTGTHPIHVELEKALAEFLKMESVVLLPSGYLANIALFQTLAREYNHILLPEYSHPSLRDAAAISGCQTTSIKTDNDYKSNLLNKNYIIATEGTTPDGSGLSPLHKYKNELVPPASTLVVDDAHGFGTLGQKGRGSWEEAGFSGSDIILTGTLSKALGGYGGFISGNKALINRIKTESMAYVGSSALSLPVCAAVITALAVLTENNYKIVRFLRSQTIKFKKRLKNAGLPIEVNPLPVVVFKPETEVKKNQLSDALIRNKIFPPFINYPGGPENGYFRFSLSSCHSEGQIELLANLIEDWL